MSLADYRVKATAAGGSIRAIAARTTSTALSVQMAHQASFVAAAALGRLLPATSLLAADFKDDFRLTLTLEGDGPLGRVVSEIRTGGFLRARAEHPRVDLPLRSDGKLAVGQAVGHKGILRVARQEFQHPPYEGQSPLVSGEIGEDLAHYYRVSEQIPAAVGLGVLIGTEGTVVSSGGLVIQALPGHQERTADLITEKFQSMNNISWRLSQGETPEDLLEALLPSPIQWSDPEPLSYQCQCSREGSLEIIESLPEADLDALIQENGAEVVCHFCNTAYPISLAELEWVRSVRTHSKS